MAIHYDHDLTNEAASHWWNSLSAMPWLNDALATLGLVAFIASAFVLAEAVCALVAG